MPDVSDLVSTAEIAQEWDVDVRTVHRWVERGLLTPCLRAPGRRGAYLFQRKDLQRMPRAAA